MTTALILACVLLQDPKPGSRTVEDRLKELDGKLTALEMKQRDLSEENAAMEKKIADAKASRESAMRQSAKLWVQHLAKPLGLSQKQAEELENLRYGWSTQDWEKPADIARWKAREALLREKVSAEQASQLARRVRGNLEASAKALVGMFAQTAKLDLQKTAALTKATLDAIPEEEGVLLVEAHPEGVASWSTLSTTVESVLPKVSPPLTEAEQKELRQVLAPWKPKRP